MKITIDRVVVLKKLRVRFNLTAGTEMEIEAVGDVPRLRRAGSETPLVRRHGILVHHGSTRVNIDTGEFIRAERDARSSRMTNDAD